MMVMVNPKAKSVMTYLQRMRIYLNDHVACLIILNHTDYSTRQQIKVYVFADFLSRTQYDKCGNNDVITVPLFFSRKAPG